VLLACVRALADNGLQAVNEATGVPRRTVGRWLDWWRTTFIASALWSELRARLVPPAEASRLPASLLERLRPDSALSDAACLLMPLTTQTVSDRSRFVRLAM